MEKAFPPVLSTFNFVMIAGYGAVKIPPVYAFREIKAHENQVFPCIVGGQVGQTIQSLPKQASKCVENSPCDSAGRGGLLALRPALSYGDFPTHLEPRSGGDLIICPASPPTIRKKP